MTNRKHSEFSFWTAHIGKVKDELERLGYEAVVCNRSEAGARHRLTRPGGVMPLARIWPWSFILTVQIRELEARRRCIGMLPRMARERRS